MEPGIHAVGITGKLIQRVREGVRFQEKRISCAFSAPSQIPIILASCCSLADTVDPVP